MNLSKEFKEKCKRSSKPVKWFYFYVNYLLVLQSFANTVLTVLYLLALTDSTTDPAISITLYISMISTSLFIAIGALTVRSQMIRMKKKGIRWNRIYMTGSIILNLLTTVIIHDITTMEATNIALLTGFYIMNWFYFEKRLDCMED